MKANVQTRQQGGVCSRCRHDLETHVLSPIRKGARCFGKSDGKVYCSNTQCVHFAQPHPISNAVND